MSGGPESLYLQQSNESNLESSSLLVRTEGISISDSQDLSSALDQIIPVLATKGLTLTESMTRLKIFFPDCEESELRAVFDKKRQSLRQRFSQEPQTASMSDSVIEAGLLYLLSVEAGVSKPREAAVVSLNQGMIEGVSNELSRSGVSSCSVPVVLNRIQAAKEAIAENPNLTISVARYTANRSSFLADNGIASARGVSVWPVSTQSVSARLGGSWNAALASVGLSTRETPDGFGTAKFAPEEYESAVIDFRTWSANAQKTETIQDYEAWIDQENSSGRIRPSASAILSVYSTWNGALNSDGDRSRIVRATERQQHSLQPDDSPSSGLILATENEIGRLEAERTSKELDGTLTLEQAEHYRVQVEGAQATIAHYLRLDSQWAQQMQRWEENDKHSEKQFKINLTLAIGIGVGSMLVPVVVWLLETFGPKG